MSTFLMKGMIRNGRVEVDEPINLPDGSEVIVQLLNGDADADMEEGWDSSPQGIAAWLQWCDALQPHNITPQEEAVFPLPLAGLMSDQDGYQVAEEYSREKPMRIRIPLEYDGLPPVSE